MHPFKVLEDVLFVFAYSIASNTLNNEADIEDNRMYFLPREKIKNYDVLLMEEIFKMKQLMI